MSVKADEERVHALKTKFPDLDLESIDVTIAMGRAATTVERHLAKRLKSYDITPVGLQVLVSVLLADGGPVDLATVGAQVRVTKANVSLVLQGLEKQELVERAAEPTDARRIRVRMTPRGRAVLYELVPLVGEQMEEALRPLSTGDREELRRILRLIEVC